MMEQPTGEVLDPYAEDLIESLRSFGYDLPTALADLIDNSVRAEARHVSIEYCSDPGGSWVAVVDDGEGMDEEELHEAMRFARNPHDGRTWRDLGRFGLGLKTASLSQARVLTVVSRGQSGRASTRTWDIDHVNRHRKWLVITEPDEEVRRITAELGFEGRGTVVLWRHLDRLGEGAELSRRINEAGRHLSLLFHRFMADGRLRISIGGRELTPLDPYLLRHSKTQYLGSETLEHNGRHTTVKLVVLPHPSFLSRQDIATSTGPGGMLDRQGFYVYRGDRLVVPGSWLGLPGMNKSTSTRLARLAVEISPEADLDWDVDVRKSRVRPPTALQDRIIRLAEIARACSERVFTHRGTPDVTTRRRRDIYPVWQRVRRLGQSEYLVNRSHPLVAAALDSPNGRLMEGVLRLIETTLPRDLMQQELALSTNGAATGEADDSVSAEEVLALFRSMLVGLPEDPASRASLVEALAGAEPFSRYPGLIKEVIDADPAKESL